MKVNVTTIGLALHLVVYATPAGCSDKNAQHLSNSAIQPEASTESSEEKNQSWSGPLMLQPTDLVALVETVNLEERSQELNALKHATTTTGLPQEKATFAREHRKSLIAFKEKKQAQEDPGLAAMELAAYEVAAQLMQRQKAASGTQQ